MKLADFLNQHGITIDIDPHEFKWVLGMDEFGKSFDVVVDYNSRSLVIPFYAKLEETREDALRLFWPITRELFALINKTKTYEGWCKALNFKISNVSKEAWQQIYDLALSLEDLLGTDLFMDLLFHTEE